MAQPPPTLINLPPPGSNPDTPSEMPGTPTSTTTSLSALSTTAIKDGQRGHLPHGPAGRGHAHNPSTTSLEAERADRISRLAGLERVSTLRPNHGQEQQSGAAGGASSLSPQTTPTSTGGFPTNFPLNHQNPAPAYFDAHGQPTATTKMSTVGTASATESYPGEDNETRAAPGDRDEDMLSTDTNYREGESVASMGADHDHMDEDMEGMGTRSVGGYEDRMSDDGSASLVGFGEGANSTVSGPIYQRRPNPLVNAQGGAGGQWTLERTSSGLSDGIPAQRGRDVPLGSETPVSAAAMQERRDARMMDGIAADQMGSHMSERETFVDTTNRDGVTMAPGHQRPAQQQAPSQLSAAASREAAERLLRERLNAGIGNPSLGTTDKPGPGLGKFSFEEKR